MLKSSAPVPWIGLYAAIASAACVCAATADLVRGIIRKDIWLPCRYFALNAATLTVLAVAVKLPMDLTTPMPGRIDQLAKLSSTVFLCTAMSHFLPSLGSMNDKEILVNLAALGILIVTLCVNVVMQLFTGVINEFRFVHPLVIALILYAFLILSSSALTVSASKRYLSQKYDDLHETVSDEEQGRNERSSFDELRLCVKKYWIMAKTSSPQFLMARSEACYVVGYLALVASSILLITSVHLNRERWGSQSEYEWSVNLIYISQVLGVSLCLLSSCIRLLPVFFLSMGRLSKINSTVRFQMKNYWIKRLVEWKKRPPPLQVQSRTLRKIIHKTRNLLLSICIGVQVVIMVTNKLLLPISFFAGLFYFLWQASPYLLVVALFLSFLLMKRLRRKMVLCLAKLKKKLLGTSEAPINQNVSEQSPLEPDFGAYVLLLEGEDVAAVQLKSICSSLDSFIDISAKKQPRHLMELLKKSTSFKGVAEFDSNQIPKLNPVEPPNSWSLPVITLTSIAIALPSIESYKGGRLLQCVIAGLKHARLVEKNLDSLKKLVPSIDAADSVWTDVESNGKWLDIDLWKMTRESRSSRETLEFLASQSEEIVKDFTTRCNGNLTSNTTRWPLNVVAATSMYRISRTLLLDYEESSPQEANMRLFERISNIIADILAACFSNLPYLILMKCYSSSFEERERSVEDAAHLLGETKDIITALLQHELPSLTHDNLPYIDAWRDALICCNHNTSTTPIINEDTNLYQNEQAQHEDIDVTEAANNTAVSRTSRGIETQVGNVDGGDNIMKPVNHGTEKDVQ